MQTTKLNGLSAFSVQMWSVLLRLIGWVAPCSESWYRCLAIAGELHSLHIHHHSLGHSGQIQTHKGPV